VIDDGPPSPWSGLLLAAALIAFMCAVLAVGCALRASGALWTAFWIYIAVCAAAGTLIAVKIGVEAWNWDRS
jgi:hypothetical protein